MFHKLFSRDKNNYSYVNLSKNPIFIIFLSSLNVNDKYLLSFDNLMSQELQEQQKPTLLEQKITYSNMHNEGI